MEVRRRFLVLLPLNNRILFWSETAGALLIIYTSHLQFYRNNIFTSTMLYCSYPNMTSSLYCLSASNQGRKRCFVKDSNSATSSTCARLVYRALCESASHSKYAKYSLQ